jgi:uncharacterized repeat protein (TIGR01451 family)
MSGTSDGKDLTPASAGRRRSWWLLVLALMATMALMATTALPGFAGGSHTEKIYTLVVTPGQATSGQSTDFFVTMTNKTPGNSNPNSFSVTAPAGFTVTAASISSATNPNSSATVTRVGSTIKVRSLDPVKTNQFVTLKVTAVPPSGSCNQTGTWTAKVWTGSHLFGNTFRLINPGTAQQTIVLCAPDLSVSKTPVSTPISVGDDLQFDITVSNASGAGTAANVVVTDTLPAGLTWSVASQTASACSIGSGALTCTIPTLAGGASYSVRVAAAVASGGTVTNDGVTVTLDDLTVASAGPASIDVLAPGLNVAKTAIVSVDEGTTWSAASSATAGDLIGYDLVVTNSGPGASKGVVATDTLPTDAGLSWSIASQTGDACSISGALTCAIGAMPSDTSYSVRITSPTTSATVADSPVDNTIHVTSDNADPVESSASIDVWEGQLGCPSIQDQGFEYTATTSGEAPSVGQLARLENLDASECIAKPYNFDTLLNENANVISFTQGSLAGQEQAQFVMQIAWDPALPTTAAETYPTTIAGRTTLIQYTDSDPLHAVQWCTAVQYDEDGNVVSATLPTRVDPGHLGEPENWCLVNQSAVARPDGKVAVTEVFYGFGDPGIVRQR